MKFMLFALPTVPAETFEERQQLRPIGRNDERFQQMLDQLRKMAVFADQAGFEVMGTTEHHFHSEGFEASIAPLLLYTDLAARTQRLKFCPLGLVLAAWDPIRCAEELAMLDQLTQGRLYVGFARGYQDRWVNVMGQQFHSTGATMDGSEVDNHNRAVFEEAVKVIKKAWTQQTFNHDGEYYRFNKVFSAFGFFEAYRTPEDADKYPLDPYTPLPPEEWSVERLRRVRYSIAGTPDQVKYLIDDQHKMHQGDGELEWFGWFFDQGLMAWEEQERQLEMFAKHIIPAFGD